MHWPPVHRSATVEEQAVQEPPAVPHAASCWFSQVPLLSQQPLGQDVALQTQAPFWQTWPIAHSVEPPHVQAPAVHASERLESHATHAAPLAPHSESEGVAVHVLFEQQPVAQEPFGPAVHWQLPLTHA